MFRHERIERSLLSLNNINFSSKLLPRLGPRNEWQNQLFMKNYVHYRLLLFALLPFQFSCDKEEEIIEKSMVFDTGSVSYSLTDSKLYLVEQGTYDGRAHRVYYISDGEYTVDGDGDGIRGTLGDFENASFALRVDLLSPVGGSLTPGDYPQRDYFFAYPISAPPATSTVSHIFMTINSGFTHAPYYGTDDGRNTDPSPVKVLGGFNNGEVMTIEFNGKLTHSYYPFPEVGWVDETSTCKLFFSGKVLDKRN